ncbi:MAG: protein-export chaperone SecB [Thiolinea sp.]
MNFTLKSTKVERLLLAPETRETGGLNFYHALAEDDSKRFLIVFEFIMSLGDTFSLEVTYLAEFEADEPVDEERDNKLLTVNAPAIAYPFLRAYIATVLLNSGLPPVMLPTFNFVEFARQQEQNDDVKHLPDPE